MSVRPSAARALPSFTPRRAVRRPVRRPSRSPPARGPLRSCAARAPSSRGCVRPRRRSDGRARPRPRSHSPFARRRGRARPSDRRLGRTHPRDDGARAAQERRGPRAGGDLLGRRTGRRTARRGVKEGNARAADGRTLMYLERGPAGGAPVFYLHGTPGSRLSRHPDADLYERLGVRVITYDRPGYGGSDPDLGRSVASAAKDVRTIAGALGIARFGVIGISGGGPHALACAALLPDLVARVAVLVSPAPIDDPDFDWLAGMSELNVREFRAAMESEEAFAAEVAPFVEALRTDPGAFVDALAADLP